MDRGHPLVETSNRDMEAKDGERWGERKTSDCEQCLATSMVQVCSPCRAESAVWMCVNLVEQENRLRTNQQCFLSRKVL